MIKNKLIWLIMPVFMLLLSSCGPVYETRNEYIPPASAGGLACLQRIEAKRQSCTASCSAKLQVCKNKALEQAKLTLPEQYKEYAHQLELYNSEMERYRLEERHHEHEYTRISEKYEYYKDKCAKDPVYCGRKKELSKQLKNLKYSRYGISKPSLPGKPTLESETLKHEQSCDTECGCQQEYDKAYVSCGGRVVPHQICTRNCENLNK